MKAEDIKRHFEGNGRNAVFVFEENFVARDEILKLDLGPDFEIVEYKGDAFVLKHKIRTLPVGKRIVVVVDKPSPLATGRDASQFPLLGELMANGELETETPQSFMSAKGLNMSDQSLAAFVGKHHSEMMTAAAESVFADSFADGFTAATAARGLVSVNLGSSTMLEWREIFVRLMIYDAETAREPTKKSRSAFLFNAKNNDVLAEVIKQCLWMFGVEPKPPSGSEVGQRGFFSGVAERLKYNAVTRPLAKTGKDPYIAKLKETDSARLDRMDQFLRWAAESLAEKQKKRFFASVEVLSEQVREDRLVEAYGCTAHFGFYTERLAVEVIRALAASGFGSDSEDKAKTAERVAASGIVGDNLKSLALSAAAIARFYAVRSGIGTFTLNSREEFVTAYTGGWWRLDREYRIALEHYAAIAGDGWRAILEDAKDAFETDVQEAFNVMNLAWTEALSKAGGCDGIGGTVRQEDFYSTKLDLSNKVAVIVSDALRYEVALEVMDRINADRGSVTMEAGIARLPTDTKYTKAALLPHSSVEFLPEKPLSLDGGKATITTADKEKILAAHCADGRCVTAKDLDQMGREEKRELFKRKVVYVFHDSIDEKGHGDTTGRDVAKACRGAVDELFNLVKTIQNTCNVNHLWLVADHGFIMGDRAIPDGEKIPVEEVENAFEKTTRYYFTQRGDAIHGIVKFTLAGGGFVAVPAGTRRFKAMGGYSFVHGGASLQEMVIPVMHSRLLGSGAYQARGKVGVTILGVDLRVQSSRLRFELLQNEAVSAEVQERIVRCALYAESTPVSNIVEVKLDSHSASLEGRKKSVELVLTSSAPGILSLKVFSDADSLNALAEKTVTNNTLIEHDEW